MTVCSCGHKTGPSDRYCPQCGVAATGVAASGPVASEASPGSGDSVAGDSDLMLLNPVSNDQVETSSEVQTGFPVRLAVVGGLAIAALTWALFAWPQEESTAGQDEAQTQDSETKDSETKDSAADGSEPDQAEDISEEERSETADRADEPEQDGDDADDVDGATTQTSSGAGEEADEVDEPDPVEPLVGELTGLGLALGSYGRDEIRVISLDTGEEAPLIRGARGIPVGMIGTELVVANWERLSIVDLAVADPEAKHILEGSEIGFEGTRIVEDLIWTATFDDGDPSYRMIGLTTDGREVGSVELDNPAFFFFGSVMTTDVITSPGGGVYVRNGDSYNRLSTGTLRAVGESIMLIDECDDRRRCASVWYSRDELTPVDLPEPPAARIDFSSLAGGDRWLVVNSFQDGGVSLIEVATGEVVRTTVNTNNFGPSTGVTISDDGRWLFEVSGFNSSSIVDLDSGQEWPLDIRVTPDAVAKLIDLSGTTFESG